MQSFCCWDWLLSNTTNPAEVKDEHIRMQFLIFLLIRNSAAEHRPLGALLLVLKTL